MRAGVAGLLVVVAAMSAGCGAASTAGPGTTSTMAQPPDDCTIAGLPVEERPGGPRGIEPTPEFESIGWSVERYGKRFPEQFAGVRSFLRGDVPIVGVGFTGDLETHREAISRLVSDPSAVLVCQTRYSQRDLDAVFEGLPKDGSVRSWVSSGWDLVDVWLRADQAQLANDLRSRHPDKVRIRLGRHPYPPESWADADARACPVLPEEATSELVATVTLRNSTVRAGADFTAEVRIANRGNDQTGASFGINHLMVLRPGTNDVVAVYDGAWNTIGYGANPKPGETSDPIAMTGGTGSCAPGAPPALSPGEFDVIAAIPANGGAGPILPFERARLTVVP